MTGELSEPENFKFWNSTFRRQLQLRRHTTPSLKWSNLTTISFQVWQGTGEWHLDIRDSKSARDARLKNILRDQNDINESTRAQLDAISTALTELQAKEPRKHDRRPIGFIVPDEKKGWNARLYLMFDERCNKS